MFANHRPDCPMLDRVPLRRRSLVLGALSAVIAGCGPVAQELRGATPAATRTAAEQIAHAPPVDLATGGLAVLTPTAAFGQEENRQALGLTFSRQLAELRPDLPSVPMSKALSAINAAGLAESYDRLYTSYRNSGLFDREPLRQIGAATGARYLVQLKLQSFSENSKSRFGYFGISVLQTQTANARVFAQVWDSVDGRIVWERANEAAQQKEGIRERPIGMERTIEAATADLVRQLPR